MAQAKNGQSKVPFHQEIANALIAQLKAGTAPWQKPWKPGEYRLPQNGNTGRPYHGANLLRLTLQGYSDPRWVTFKQARDVGAQVRKGEMGTRVQFWMFSEQVTKRDEHGKPVLGENGKPKKETVSLERPRVKQFYVFNAEQIDNFPPLPEKALTPDWERHEKAEVILKNSGANIQHGMYDIAAYIPAQDKIVLPGKEDFPTADAYYATALHELGHWTSHSSRLERELGPRNSEAYAREELRAEISSLMVGGEIGIGHDPGQHAAYVKSWIKILEDDPKEIVRASKDAEQIANYVLDFAYVQEKQLSEDVTPDAEDNGLSKENIMLNERRDALMQVLTAASREKLQEADHAYEAERKQQLLNGGSLNEYDSERLRWANDERINRREELQEIVVNADRKISSLSSEMGDASALDYIQENLSEVQEEVLNPQLSREEQEQGLRRDSVSYDLVLEEGRRLSDAEKELSSALSGVWSIGDDAPSEEYETALTRVENAREDVSEARLQLEMAHITVARKIDQLSQDNGLSAALDYVEENKDEVQEELRQDNKEQRAKIASKVGGEEKQAPASQNVNERIYLDVPFSEKNEAKALGAKWDKQEKSWFITANMPVSDFQKWSKDSNEAIQENKQQQEGEQKKTYLAVPYVERQKAKDAGAKWDKEAKSWFVEGDIPVELEAFLPGKSNVADDPAMNIQEEFSEALKSLGLQPEADRKMAHPIIDGQTHRVPVEGDKRGERSGAYVCHADGNPAGFIINYKTGETTKWSAKGQSLNKEDMAALRAQAAEHKRLRDLEREKKFDETSLQVTDAFSKMPEMTEHNLSPYLERKGISVDAAKGIKAGPSNTIVIPAFDVNGKQWTAQYINADGTKRFAKDSRKTGCFYPVNGMETLETAKTVVVCEGFATAASIKKAVPDMAVVAAFDAGNLGSVAETLAQKYPDKPMIIAGDNDAHAMLTSGKNVGKEKAFAAAQQNGAICIFPAFLPEEKKWPNDVPKFSPQEWRAGEVTEEQKEAYSRYKELTDFNDLSEKSRGGPEQIRYQIQAAESQAQQLKKEVKNTQRQELKREERKTIKRRSVT